MTGKPCLLGNSRNSSAAIFENVEEKPVAEYLGKIDEMRKVVLACPDEGTLLNASSDLGARQIAHKLWIEQPENIPTCIATMVSASPTATCEIDCLAIFKPNYRSKLAPHFRKFKLFC